MWGVIQDRDISSFPSWFRWRSISAYRSADFLHYSDPQMLKHIFEKWISELPVVPARGGAELALGIYYKTFLIYRTCMHRAPARPLRACILRKRCPVSHATFEAPLRTSHFSLQSSHSTLHTSHSTLHTSHCTLRTPHFSSHCATPHFTLHTSHSALHSPHFSLLSSHSTLHTSHSTLHHGLFTLTLRSSRPTLHTALFTLHTPHFTSSELFSPYPSSSLLISSLLTCHPSFHPVICTKYVPVLPWTAKLAHSYFPVSQYYFVLQSLHKVLSSTTLYYKTCTKHFPVLLCTTKLAQITSQHYFVLQNLQKVLPSTTLCKLCSTK